MSYFADLSPYIYCPLRVSTPRARNIGWLSSLGLGLLHGVEELPVAPALLLAAGPHPARRGRRSRSARAAAARPGKPPRVSGAAPPGRVVVS